MKIEKPVLLTERRDGVLWLTINREGARNALNDELILALTSAIGSADFSLKAIVLTAVGTKAFCAGGDLRANSRTFIFDDSQPSTHYANLLRTARNCNIPLIARINGHCLAGGMGLLAMCDIAVASDDAQFGLPEVKIGMFPMQVVSLLKGLLPGRVLAELCLLGERITAEQALAMNLLNRVVPRESLDQAVDDILSRLRENSPSAVRQGKYALRNATDMTTEQAIAFMETQIKAMPQTADAIEGMAAFNEKRAPVWSKR